MSAGRKSSAEAGSFMVILMALKMCLLQRVMHPSLSRGTLFESISMISARVRDTVYTHSISQRYLQVVKYYSYKCQFPDFLSSRAETNGQLSFSSENDSITLIVKELFPIFS